MIDIDYKSANSLDDITEILELQQSNLARALSTAQRSTFGYVTVEHDAELLWKMNHPYPHSIAVVDDRIVGYVLVMERKWRESIEVLYSLFEQIDRLMDDQHGSYVNYFIMGQVCVAEHYRGKGIFRGLYEHLQQNMSPDFELCITEIAADNHRSLDAHLAIGFEEFHRHTDGDGIEWVIVRQDY